AKCSGALRRPGTVQGARQMSEGCFMCSGLYIKANCQLPCWDDVGEQLILRHLSAEHLAAGREENILNDPALIHIRRSFKNDELPFPDVCNKCAVRGKGMHRGEVLDKLEVLHVEPSFLCALACPLCISPRERLKIQKGLSPRSWQLQRAAEEPDKGWL